MNQLAPKGAGFPAAIPAAFQSMGNLPDMNSAAQAGGSLSFAVVGFRGKDWRVKFAGKEKVHPARTLDVVIVGVAEGVSKQFYAKAYAEGDDAAPDCFSVNGIVPDATSTKKQCDTCAACPQNAFGSRITQAGKKAKACQDNKRLAIVPYADIENKDDGGPMMLRLPVMSIGNLSRYSQEIARFGAQPYMVVTRLGFADTAYPQITFEAVGWVTDDAEAKEVIAQTENPVVDRILYSEVKAEAPSPLAGGMSAVFKQPPPAALAPPAPAPEPTPKPTLPPAASAAPPPAPEQEVEAETNSTTVVQQVPPDMEADIDRLLGL